MHKIKLTDIETKSIFYDKLTYIYLELPKFKKDESELKTHFDKWMYVLKHLQNLQNRPIALQEKIFEKLFKTAEIAMFTVQERREYEDNLKYYRDMVNIVDSAKEEGIEQGIEQGKEDVARNLKKLGMDIEVIIKSTGLTKEQIDNF